MKIDVYPDGDKICAIIGEMPTETAIGFGDDALDAIEALTRDLRSARRCGKCLSKDIEFLDNHKSTYRCKCCGNRDFYPWWEDCQAYKEEIEYNENHLINR